MQIIKKFFIVILIVMILYVGLALYSDVEKFSKVFIDIDYWYVLPILILMTINNLLLGIRFYRMIRILGIDISFKKSITIYLASLSLEVTPAGAGQIIQSHMIKKASGDAISKTLPVVIVEKWSELVSILVILASFLFIENIIESQIILIIGLVISFILAGIMRISTIFSGFKKIIKKVWFLKELEENIENSQNTLKILMSSKMILEGLLITIPAKIIYAVSAFLAFQAVGIKLDFIFSTHIFFTSLITGVISLLPGGFGVTEGSMVGLLAKYGNDFTVAAAAVIFVRLTTIWYSTILGFIITKFVIKNAFTPN
ncbi:MAG: lysylphosphatidylglycerol synthase transmembrane domain-containing protein [Nitrosopumilaceae archaeon]